MTEREWKQNDELGTSLVASPKSEEGAPAFELQRRAGNRATAAALQRQLPLTAKATGPSLPRMLASLPEEQVGLQPAEDATAEAEADAVAERVGRGEAGAMPDMSGVHVHADSGATAMARDMGARAFTQGSSVFVDRDELRAPDARQLLAHEATHATRHASSGLVHAKMRGLKDALVSQGGGPTTTGRLRKLVKRKTNWDKIVDGLAAYEKFEAELLGRSPDQKSLNAAKPQMVKMLKAVEASCARWAKANGGSAAGAWSEGIHAMALARPGDDDDYETTPKGKQTQQDDRSKAPRRQAIAMLLPRLRTELKDVAAGEWNRTLGLSDDDLTGSGKSAAGGMNKVQELMYQTEQGAFTGYFKDDKGFDAKMAGQDLQSGIRQADPNYSARSVAMYRLDQLLNVGVTARAEFAVHDGKMGLALESAKGTRAADANMALTGGAAQVLGGDTLSAEDPVLLRCLNKLQVLDAIAGQLDRHGGNYYIQSSGGRVTGVTGIDLDMAFGQDLMRPDREAGATENYKGVPAQFDEQLSMRVLQVKAADIQATLQGLLSAAEIEATISRLNGVQDAMRQALGAGRLVTSWEGKSQRLDVATNLAKGDNRETYAQDMQILAVDQASQRCKAALPDLVREIMWDSPERSMKTVELALTKADIFSPPVRFVTSSIYEGRAPSDKEEELLRHAMNAVLSDQMARAKIEVACQESEELPVSTARDVFRFFLVENADKVLQAFLAGARF